MENKIKTVGLSRRLLAYYIDTFLLLIPAVGALYYIAVSSNNLNALFINFLHMVAFVVLPQAFLNILYFVFLQHNFGATIGQMFAGYRILDKDGKKLSFQILFFRQTVGKIASASFFGLGIYSIIKHPQKRAWHDEMAGSFPISKHNGWPFAIMILVFLISINGYLLYSSVITFAKNESLINDLKITVSKFQTALTDNKKNKKTQIKDFKIKTSNCQSGELKLGTGSSINNFLDTLGPCDLTYTKQILISINYWERNDFPKLQRSAEIAYHEATSDYQKGVALYFTAHFHYDQRDNIIAQDELFESIKLAPEFAPSYSLLSANYNNLKDFTNGEIYGKICVDLDPLFAYCHSNYGTALLANGKKEQGYSEFEIAVSQQPDNQNIKDIYQSHKDFYK